MPSTYEATETQRSQRISLQEESSVFSVPLWLRDCVRSVLVSLAVILAAVPCAAEWRRLDSPNFTVVGDVSAGELRDMAVKFEGFREALSRAISERATAAAVPTIIIVFPNEKAFAPFKPIYQGRRRTDVAGFFAPGANLNYILVQSGGAATDRIIFHEYAHLIVSNVMSNPPVWLNEGLAEFYSTFRLTGGGKQAQIGVAIGGHLQLLRNSGRVPLADLLKVDQRSPLYNESARVSVFYAESWALTHMVLNGEPSRVTQLSAYLRSVANGVPETRAWEETFGTARMEQDLQQYLQRNLFNTVVVEFTERITSLPVTPVPVSPGDVAAYLGAYLVQRGQYDEAAVQLDLALKADPSSPRAAVATAQLEMGRSQYGSAEKRLIALGKSDDWLVAYSAAMAMADLAGVGIAGSANVSLIQAARRQLDTVGGDRAEMPNVLAHRAALDLPGPDDPTDEAAAAIARARALAPGRYDYAFIHAQILARRGEFATARTTIGPLMTGLYPPGVRDSARSLMSYIVNAENRQRTGAKDDVAAFLAASGSKSIPVPGIDLPRPPDDGRPRFIPAYRVVQPGEARAEGTLDRIDCPAGGKAAFHLAEAGAPGGLVGRVNEVDFISYRNDLDGGVKCGALAQPIPVYITWRDSAQPAAEKAVVAVEFLPSK
jgi:tetratricopeptide (TPR) repeat protein